MCCDNMVESGGKTRVVWLCHFSNSFVHKQLALRYNPVIRIIRKLAHKSVDLNVSEYAIWITNGIKAFESIEDVELHVVSPYPHLKAKVQLFVANGITYHFFQSEDDVFLSFLFKRIIRPNSFKYRRNSLIIKRIIDSIQPQIVHLFGAENPDYAVGMLKLPKGIITIAQLQTLLNDPLFMVNKNKDRLFINRAGIEKAIIQHVNYVATPTQKYREIIKRYISPSAFFLNIGLALEEPIVTDQCNKVYDFVYFAANISKASDLALEAFAIAHSVRPEIKLDIIGSYSAEYKKELDCIVKKFGLEDAVVFEGCLPTHDDVLKQIRLSRFALLPLRVDITSGTIREAMSNGLPVITTDTGELGTQKLNLTRQNALLSPIGDHQAMANNMLRLLDDSVLAECLRQNAYQTRLEASSNVVTARKYVEAYKACISRNLNGTPIPSSIIDV